MSRDIQELAGTNKIVHVFLILVCLYKNRRIVFYNTSRLTCIFGNLTFPVSTTALNYTENTFEQYRNFDALYREKYSYYIKISF